ncbi:MAG: methyltransferase domain-containing protein [Candidatus Omnitrophota bacterium]
MRAFVIGGGSSLQGFDFNKLKGEKIIACNVAFFDIKPDVLVWIDADFYEKHKDEIDKLDCLKFTSVHNWRANWKEDIIGFNPVEVFQGKEGLTKGIYIGRVASSLTGVAAISIAIALGYEPIYLLGFDGDNYHYHNRYGQPSIEIDQKNHFYESFKGYPIYNCSLTSTIEYFPKVDIEEVLSGEFIPLSREEIIEKNFEKKEKEKYETAWIRGKETISGRALPLVYLMMRYPKYFSMLELGCGDGTTTKILRESGYIVAGADITLAGIKGDKEGFIEAPIWKLPFRANEFDITFSTDVLEHIPPEKVDDAIREIYRVTRKKTFHSIATFDHRVEECHFHLSVYPIDWWRNKFYSLNEKKIPTEIVDCQDVAKVISLEQLKKFLKHKTIAVVGNAKSIFLEEHPGIDKHNVVIRMNRGFPEKGNCKYIGERTDILAFHIQYREGEIEEKCKPEYLIFADGNYDNPVIFNANNVFIYPFSFEMELHEKLGAPASIGCKVIDLLINRLGSNPKDITLYGFDFMESESWSGRKLIFNPHNFKAEKEFIKSIILC